METKSGQEKFLWSNAMTDDMIDIICSDKIMKKIFFSETTTNTKFFERIADLVNQTAAGNNGK